MKLITLTILFSFFVLTRGAESGTESQETESDITESGTVRRRLVAPVISDDSLKFSNEALDSDTVLTYAFSSDKAFLASTGSTKTIVLAVPYFQIPGTCKISVKSGCVASLAFACTSANSGAITATVTLTGSGADLALNTACELTINGLRTPSDPRAVAKWADTSSNADITQQFTDGASDHTSADPITTTPAIGKGPYIYYQKSTCIIGGVSGGTPKNCDEGGSADCKKCTSLGDGFVVSTGMQTANTDCRSDGTTNDQFRCDTAVSFTESSVDIAVFTNGNYGTLACAALVFGQSPTYNLMEDPSTNIKARNSVYVDTSSRHGDQVISLDGLKPSTEYDIYCHWDDVVFSPQLTVWTADSDRVWDVSLVPGNTAVGASPGTITLTFTHGTALTASENLKLEFYHTTSTTMFSGNAACGCSGTTTDDGSGGTSLTITTSNSASGILTINLGSGSAAMSTVTIVCNLNMNVNPTSGTVVLYDFEADLDKHPQKLEKRYSYTTTAS